MLYTFFLILVLFLNLMLALVVFIKNPKNHTNVSFSLFIIFVVLWMFINFLSNQFTDYKTAFFVNKLIFIVTPYISFSLLYFTLVFPFVLPKFKQILSLSIIPIVISNILSFANFVIRDITFLPDGLTGVIFGNGVYFYGIQFITYIIFSLGLLLYKYKKADLSQRRQIQHIFIGIGFLTIIGTFTNFIIPFFLDIFWITNAGPLMSFSIFAFTAYAISKHNLMNIKIAATYLLVALILIILLSKLFVSQNQVAFFIDLIIFLLISFFGVLLIKSVYAEVKQKEELQKLTTKLKELDSQKNEFISMAAHELRAPLSAIKGFVSMILEGDTGDIPEKARGYLADVNSINSRLVRLVNNMLNVSRIEEGRMAFMLEEERLSHVARAVYSEFIPEGQRKGLNYKLEIPNSINDKVKVDIDKVNEVMGNFVSNALKYTEKGSVFVRLVQPEKNKVRFEVEDTGPGISQEEQKKLFQKFYRVESNVGKTTGTGLGLYISKLMVEKFGGKIGLDSKPGKGCVFWFEIPVCE